MRSIGTLFIVGATLLVGAGCSGGATGSTSSTSSSGSSGSTSESQTIAEELFKTPEADFDGTTLEGLYQISDLGLSPIRVRITGNSFAVAYKAATGERVGARASAQITELATGLQRWEVLLLESATGSTPDPCTHVLATLSLRAEKFELTLTKSGTLTGTLPLTVSARSCPTPGEANSGADPTTIEPATLTKIGK